MQGLLAASPISGGLPRCISGLLGHLGSQRMSLLHTPTHFLPDFPVILGAMSEKTLIPSSAFVLLTIQRPLLKQGVQQVGLLTRSWKFVFYWTN